MEQEIMQYRRLSAYMIAILKKALQDDSQPIITLMGSTIMEKNDAKQLLEQLEKQQKMEDIKLKKSIKKFEYPTIICVKSSKLGEFQAIVEKLKSN